MMLLSRGRLLYLVELQFLLMLVLVRAAKLVQHGSAASSLIAIAIVGDRFLFGLAGFVIVVVQRVVIVAVVAVVAAVIAGRRAVDGDAGRAAVSA